MAHDETTDEEPTIRYISLFSGIEACSVAWTNLNWECVAVADFDDFPSAVLAERYPKVPNLKDITKVDWNDYNRKADLVVGGSPCQSFSVAGKRLGMDDPRGNLAIEFLRVVEAVQPKWFIFENVAGLLSSDGGRDFAHFLSMWDLGMGTRPSLTLSGSECPNEGVASSLSEVLMEIGEVPRRYYLSPTACEGILRRAKKRGKTIPPLLEEALMKRASEKTDSEE